MAAPPPRPARRRPRRGSLERPINARMYRGTWLLVGLPALVAAFSVARPDPLPAPTLPPTFDGAAALALATELADEAPDRSPGGAGAIRAAAWVTDRLRLYGFEVRQQVFEATIPGHGRRRLINLFAVVPGPSPDSPALVVMAHRDNVGIGRGANDNASGTAALIELARPYARPPDSPAGGVDPTHTIVFLSTDGGAFGGIGAARFAAESPYAEDVTALVNLDTIAGSAPPRIELAGERPGSAPATLVQSAAERVIEQTGGDPARPAALRQLVDLAFPFSVYEHAPFVARGIPALTLTTGKEARGEAFEDSPARLDATRLAQVGSAAQQLLASLDQGLDLPPGGGSYLWLGPRIVRGWAVQLLLIAALLPFLAATVDLFARCRRRRIPLAPALRSYRSRLAFWLFVGVLFALSVVLGAWPGGERRPLGVEAAAAVEWPVLAVALLGVCAAGGWLVARERLLPRGEVLDVHELAGYAAALVALAVVSLAVTASNPYALIFVLPSLHAWLWLPQIRGRHVFLRLLVLAAGFAGPLLLLATFANRLGLGLDTLWYLGALVSLGYVEVALVVTLLAWLAVAAQFGALASSRYAPYPEAHERPPRGPVRETVRWAVLSARARRREAAQDERAAAGG